MEKKQQDLENREETDDPSLDLLNNGTGNDAFYPVCNWQINNSAESRHEYKKENENSERGKERKIDIGESYRLVVTFSGLKLSKTG